jgi:predicted SprT family Zn-dependent metalloprotease
MPDMFTNSGVAAATVSDFRYLHATIHVNVNMCKSSDEDEIEYIVIHELVHLLVSPLQESSETTPLEYTVTSIARIMQGLRYATSK